MQTPGKTCQSASKRPDFWPCSPVPHPRSARPSLALRALFGPCARGSALGARDVRAAEPRRTSRIAQQRGQGSRTRNLSPYRNKRTAIPNPHKEVLSGTDLEGGSRRIGENPRRREKPQPAAERSRNPHPRWRKPHDDGGGSGILGAAPAGSMEATTRLDEATLRTAPRGATGSATSPRWRSPHTARSTLQCAPLQSRDPPVGLRRI